MGGVGAASAGGTNGGQLLQHPVVGDVLPQHLHASAVEAGRPLIPADTLFSTFHCDHAPPLQRQELKGIGNVEGISSLAKIVLQMVRNSVYDYQAVQPQGYVQQQQRFAAPSIGGSV